MKRVAILIAVAAIAITASAFGGSSSVNNLDQQSAVSWCCRISD